MASKSVLGEKPVFLNIIKRKECVNDMITVKQLN